MPERGPAKGIKMADLIRMQNDSGIKLTPEDYKRLADKAKPVYLRLMHECERDFRPDPEKMHKKCDI